MNRASLASALVALAALASLAPLAGCKACNDVATNAAEPSPSVVVESPVPAPEGLLAEAVITTPNATWARLQRSVGGAIAVLPSTFGGLVCSLAGLDLAIADELDGAAPAYLAFGEDGKGSAEAVLAMKMRDPRHVRATLVEAETARFTASESGGMTVLVGKRQGAPGPTVALTRTGYLLVASRAADLERLGPFVHRTVAARSTPKEAVVIDVPRSALAGGVRKRIDETWAAFRADKLAQYETLREMHGGKEPDFGDPPAILGAAGGAVEGASAFVGDLDGIRIALDATDTEISADVDVTPSASPDGKGRAATAIAAMRPGDATPLLALPRASSLGLVMRDDAASRAEGAATTETALLKVLGPRLTAEHAKKLHAAIDGWTKARGDWMTASLALTDPPGVGARAPTSDVDAADRAVRDGLDLLRTPAFREPLRSLVQIRDVTFGTDDAAGLPKVNVARFERAAKAPATKGAPPRKPESLGVAWRAAEGHVLFGAGERPAEHVARMHAPDGKMGDDPAVAEAVKRLEDRVTFALFAQPSRLGIAPSGPAAGPIVLAWGKRGERGWGRAEVGYGVLRDVLRRVAGF